MGETKQADAQTLASRKRDLKMARHCAMLAGMDVEPIAHTRAGKL